MKHVLCPTKSTFQNEPKENGIFYIYFCYIVVNEVDMVNIYIGKVRIDLEGFRYLWSFQR